MVIKLLNSVNRALTHEDFGKLLSHFAVGGLMPFHGLHKLFTGTDDISGMLIARGFPSFVAYGVLLEGVVAPCLIILGILTRPTALGLASTMAVTWLVVGIGEAWTLDKTSVWAIENLVYFFIDMPAVAFLGMGRYSVTGNSVWR